MARPVPEVERELESQIARLGYELVEVEWAGSSRRPIVRIRIDRVDADGSTTIGVDDCARVSRALEPWMEEMGKMPERYVLEVSSPGVDRPLVRRRDFERFAGRKVALKGSAALAGRSTRLEGELLGLAAGAEGEERVRLRLADGSEVEVPRGEISDANLIFEW